MVLPPKCESGLRNVFCGTPRDGGGTFESEQFAIPGPRLDYAIGEQGQLFTDFELHGRFRVRDLRRQSKATFYNEFLISQIWRKSESIRRFRRLETRSRRETYQPKTATDENTSQATID